jgi:hypothetical protein
MTAKTNNDQNIGNSKRKYGDSGFARMTGVKFDEEHSLDYGRVER